MAVVPLETMGVGVVVAAAVVVLLVVLDVEVDLRLGAFVTIGVKILLSVLMAGIEKKVGVLFVGMAP